MSNINTPDISTALMQADTNRISSAKISPKKMHEIDVASKEFEAVFISEMMKPMFAGIKTNEMFGGGKTEDVFRGVLLQEYGKMISETGQIGIAEHVKTEMIKMQGGAV